MFTRGCESSMHTLGSRFCIPRELCGEYLPVSTQNELSSCCAMKHGAIRFFVGWLFLHRRLRVRQRGSTAEAVSGLCTRLADHFQRALLVFIRVTSESPEELSSKPFGFDQGVNSCIGFRCVLLSNNASPLLFASPCIGQTPVSEFDCRAILHPKISLSRRIYFKCHPNFIGVLWKNCGNLMWKNCG